jgi:hypothetical protein
MLPNPLGLVDAILKITDDAAQMPNDRALLDHQSPHKPIIPRGLHVVTRTLRQRREDRRIGAEPGAQPRRTNDRNRMALVEMMARPPFESMATATGPRTADQIEMIAAATAGADEGRPVDPGQRRAPGKREALHVRAVVDQNICRLSGKAATPVAASDLGDGTGRERADPM